MQCLIDYPNRQGSNLSSFNKIVSQLVSQLLTRIDYNQTWVRKKNIKAQRKSKQQVCCCRRFREVVEGASEGGLACPGQAHQEQACAQSRCPGGARTRLWVEFIFPFQDLKIQMIWRGNLA